MSLSLACSHDGLWCLVRDGARVASYSLEPPPAEPPPVASSVFPGMPGAVLTAPAARATEPVMPVAPSGRAELPSADADCVFLGQPAMLLSAHRDDETTRLALYSPAAIDRVAELSLAGAWRVAAVTGTRAAMISPDARSVTLVRATNRSLVAQLIDPGGVIDGVVGMDRNQLAISTHKRAELWDAVAARPLQRLQLPVPPPPRTIGTAAGHWWVTRPGVEQLLLIRLSDGRPFPHQLGTPVLSIASHPGSPWLVVISPQGLLRLSCFAHQLVALDVPAAAAFAVAPAGPAGDDASLLGTPSIDVAPWRLRLSVSTQPAAITRVSGRGLTLSVAPAQEIKEVTHAIASAAAPRPDLSPPPRVEPAPTETQGGGVSSLAPTEQELASAALRMRNLRLRAGELGDAPPVGRTMERPVSADLGDAGIKAAPRADDAAQPPWVGRSLRSPAPSALAASDERHSTLAPSPDPVADAAPAPPASSAAPAAPASSAAPAPPASSAAPAAPASSAAPAAAFPPPPGLDLLAPPAAPLSLDLLAPPAPPAPPAAPLSLDLPAPPAPPAPRERADPRRSDPPASAPRPAPLRPATWRDELARYGLTLSGEPPPIAGELEAFVRRLELPAAARRAAIALYGAYLGGSPFLPMPHLAACLGEPPGWSEALGVGVLGKLALLRHRDGAVAFRRAVLDAIDGRPWSAIRITRVAAERGAPFQPRREATRVPLALWPPLAARLGKVALVCGKLRRAVLEARLVDAVAVSFGPIAAYPAPWPQGAKLLVVTDDATGVTGQLPVMQAED